MDIQQENNKIKPIYNTTNIISNSYAEHQKRWAKFEENHWLLLEPIKDVDILPDLPSQFKCHNVHPMLALYKLDLHPASLSHDDLTRLLAPEHELE